MGKAKKTIEERAQLLVREYIMSGRNFCWRNDDTRMTTDEIPVEQVKCLTPMTLQTIQYVNKILY